MVRESRLNALPGVPMILLLFVLSGLAIWQLVAAALAQSLWPVLGWTLALLVLVFLWFGFFVVQPNDAQVLQLFGSYVGSAKDAGLWWANPFYTKRRISLRVRNFETEKLKVNDHDGNPIEIAAVVVWKVVDTAEAMFEVDDYENYVARAERVGAARPGATSIPYDAHADGEQALATPHGRGRGHAPSGRSRSGSPRPACEVIEARISHLAYAPEIAQRDAAAPAGQRHHRGAPADRRGRGRHGGDGAAQLSAKADRAARRGAQGARWSATCWWCSAASRPRSRS